jgi:thioredoxin 1
MFMSDKVGTMNMRFAMMHICLTDDAHQQDRQVVRITLSQGMSIKQQHTLTMKSSFSSLIASETPTIIDFFATWCGPCRAVSPILADLKSDLGDGVRIFKIDVDNNQALASEYKVQSIPTLMIFQNGELKWRETGVQSKAKLKSVLEGIR